MPGEDELIVWKNSIAMKEVAFTSATKPQDITLRAYEKGTMTSLKLNGADFMEVPLTLNKETINIKISGGKLFHL